MYIVTLAVVCYLCKCFTILTDPASKGPPKTRDPSEAVDLYDVPRTSREFTFRSGSRKKKKDDFCVCSRKILDGETMIECMVGLRCGGWVHPECVALDIKPYELESMGMWLFITCM